MKIIFSKSTKYLFIFKCDSRIEFLLPAPRRSGKRQWHRTFAREKRRTADRGTGTTESTITILLIILRGQSQKIKNYRNYFYNGRHRDADVTRGDVNSTGARNWFLATGVRIAMREFAVYILRTYLLLQNVLPSILNLYFVQNVFYIQLKK